MTCAPCFAASFMCFTCRSIIESLSPVQAHWTSAAFTVVIVAPPSSKQRMARSVSSRHPRDLGSCRGPAPHLAHRRSGLVGDVSPSQERHEHVVRDECGTEAPEPCSGLEPDDPGSHVALDVYSPP